MKKKKQKDSLGQSTLILNISVITVLTIFACFSAFVSFKEVTEMRKVIKNISTIYEVNDEKPKIYNKSKSYQAGYMAAMMDKRYMPIFRKYYKNKRDHIIFKFFDSFEK